MRIRGVGHACLEIETRGLRIVTHPWWAGPAFLGRRQATHPARPDGLTRRPIDALIVTSGLDDHLHLATLREFEPSDAFVIVPERLTGDDVHLIRSQTNLRRIVELRHDRPARIFRGLQATSYTLREGAILILEDDDQVVAITDPSLHTSTSASVDRACELIRTRHPSIDTLFFEPSGHAWHPGAIRRPGQHGPNAVRAFESRLVERIIRVVRRLQPRLACELPAHAHFTSAAMRWTNDVRFEIEPLQVLLRRRCPSITTQVHSLLPGDVVEGHHVTRGEIDLPATTSTTPLTTSIAAPTAIAHRLDRQLRRHSFRLLMRPGFSVDLRVTFSTSTSTVIHVRYDGREARARVGRGKRPDAHLELDAELLAEAMTDARGIDVIRAGGGSIATLAGPRGMPALDGLLTLLTPHPAHWQRLVAQARREPRRMLGAIWSQREPLLHEIMARTNGAMDAARPFESTRSEERFPLRAA